MEDDIEMDSFGKPTFPTKSGKDFFAREYIASDDRYADYGGWKLTTVRWLRENHPKYVDLRDSKHVADKVLENALGRMSYLENPGVPREEAALWRRKLLNTWDQSNFESVRSFLARGGYGAAVESTKASGGALLLEAMDKEKAAVLASMSCEVVLPDDAAEALGFALKQTKKSAEVIDQDMNDVIEAAGPRAGSW